MRSAAVRDLETAHRKLEHIKLVLSADVDYRVSTLFDDVILLHNALPELSTEEIDTSAELFGRKFDMPLMIDSMTGGTKIAERINRNLAEAAREANIPVSCGSQRAAVEDPSLAGTYRVMRRVGGDVFIVGNIGAQQLVEDPVRIATEVVSMIDADALAIHLNPLQEAVQSRGNVDLRGCMDAISDVVKGVGVPVIVKETGAGISAEVASRLAELGVAAINVSGAGGTSWSAVELERLRMQGASREYEVYRVFRDWGIPTAAALIEVVRSVNIPVIASGGLRTGLDIAKAMALGASFTGIAKPFLRLALEGKEEVAAYISVLKEQLRTAMFLTGARNIEDLRKVKYVIVGRLREWLMSRGLLRA